MEWYIGNVKINNQIVLAPMAGISNPAYMKIVEEMGCGLAITELISAEAIVRNNKKTLDMLKGIDTLEMPVGIQLFGSNADVLSKAAKIVTDLFNVAFIDINMGCPVPKVAVRAKSGSYLLKFPDKVFEIVNAVKSSINIPVTVKIRSGWDCNSINAVTIAKVIEQAGASAIFVHPRTRSQGYSGVADWKIIKDVKDSVKIPVIGNGDIKTPYDCQRMLNETGCDAVMIGRGVMGNPWLIKNSINYLKDGKFDDNVSVIERVDMCLKHLKYLCAFRDEKTAVLEIRNHISWYFKSIKGASDLKNKVYKCCNIHDIINILNDFKEEFE